MASSQLWMVNIIPLANNALLYDKFRIFLIVFFVRLVFGVDNVGQRNLPIWMILS